MLNSKSTTVGPPPPTHLIPINEALLAVTFASSCALKAFERGDSEDVDKIARRVDGLCRIPQHKARWASEELVAELTELLEHLSESSYRVDANFLHAVIANRWKQLLSRYDVRVRPKVSRERSFDVAARLPHGTPDPAFILLRRSVHRLLGKITYNEFPELFLHVVMEWSKEDCRQLAALTMRELSERLHKQAVKLAQRYEKDKFFGLDWRDVA